MKNNTIIDFFKEYGKCINTIGTMYIFPPVICNDGTFLSVQAGSFYGSSPKEDIESFEYDEVEVRYTNDTDDIMMDDIQRLLCAFYSPSYGTYYNVSVDTVNAIIEHHGGINKDAVKKAINDNKK